MSRLLALALLGLTACGDRRVGDDPIIDADGDGVEASLDCDDADAEVFPGNDEVCDAKDNDCNGQVDDAAPDQRAFHADADQDGFGTSTGVTFACFAPEGFVDNDQDCDDTNDAVHPGAPERCDELDNDCNDLIDDDPPDGELWYPDNDRDGFGSDADVIRACGPVGGHLPFGGDCNDNRPLTNPDGVEICDIYDEDEDCDGLADDEDDDTLGRFPWYVDVDGDGYGDRDTPIYRCEEPEGRIAEGGDCRDDLDGVHPGVPEEVCDNGLDDNCDDHAGECGIEGVNPATAADVTLEGEQAGAQLGSRVIFPGDLDGDGIDDLAIAAPDFDQALRNRGQVGIWTGPRSGETSIRRASTTWLGDAELGVFGSSLLRAGDVDADGKAELWVGQAGSTPGVVTLLGYEGPSAPNAVITGTDGVVDGLGASLALGLLDGDAVSDLVVGARHARNEDGTPVGAVYVFRGTDTVDGASLSVADATTTVLGESSRGACGSAVLTADLDGDGTDALIVGCPNVDSFAGQVLVYGELPDGTVSTYDADWTLAGTAPAGAGSALAVADLDDDGLDDLIVGQPGAGGSLRTYAGQVAILLGDLETGDTLAGADHVLQGEYGNDTFGWAIATGDLDGDGQTEVIVGAPLHDDLSGRTYVFRDLPGGTLSAADADTLLTGEEAGDGFGAALDVGDINGDGYDDLFLGAPIKEVVGAGAGVAYVFWGGAGF